MSRVPEALLLIGIVAACGPNHSAPVEAAEQGDDMVELTAEHLASAIALVGLDEVSAKLDEVGLRIPCDAVDWKPLAGGRAYGDCPTVEVLFEGAASALTMHVNRETDDRVTVGQLEVRPAAGATGWEQTVRAGLEASSDESEDAWGGGTRFWYGMLREAVLLPATDTDPVRVQIGRRSAIR